LAVGLDLKNKKTRNLHKIDANYPVCRFKDFIISPESSLSNIQKRIFRFVNQSGRMSAIFDFTMDKYLSAK